MTAIINAIAIAVAILITYAILRHKRARDEARKLYGKEYEIDLIDGAYKVIADRRKFEQLYQTSIPAYINGCYSTARGMFSRNDMDFDKRVALKKLLFKTTRKTLGKLLFKCKLRGIVFSYTVTEYQDIDIREIVTTKEEK